MKKSKLNFHLFNPCDKVYQLSETGERHLHCASCATPVVDFAKMSNAEILSFFQDKRNRKYSCGRFTKEQLQKGISIEGKKRLFSPLAKKVASVSIIGLTLTGAPVQLEAQVTQEIKVINQQEIVQHEPTTDTTKVFIYEHPAEYGIMESEKLVYLGGFVDFVTLNAICGVNAHQDLHIHTIKKALQERRFFEGELNDIISDEFKAAIVAFRKQQGLTPAFVMDEDLFIALGLLK